MNEENMENFGKFIFELRKEKGMTQKELAEKLMVTDKAVSKWERCLSLPDISLLLPLSKIFDVTVTELLSGKRIESDSKLSVNEVESLMDTALNLTSEEKYARNKSRKKREKIYFLSAAVLGAEIIAMYFCGFDFTSSGALFITAEILLFVFGTYFTFFIKDTLPRFYDEGKISFYSDGFFRINLIGVHFNNRNWGHIIKTVHTTMMSVMTIFPIVCFFAFKVFPTHYNTILMIIFFPSVFSIFAAVYFPAVKHK